MNNTTLDVQFDDCFHPSEFEGFSRFLSCYIYICKNNLIGTLFTWMMIIIAILANILVLYIKCYRSNTYTIFDRILIGHLIVDLLTAIFDIPFYHFYYSFGYWPFGSVTLRYWSILDNALVIITMNHMLFASYCRLRSIQHPMSYKHEFLLRNSNYVMLSFWILGGIIWIPIINSFGLIDYSSVINYSPFYLISIVTIFTWIIPNSLIYILFFYIVYLLTIVKNKKNIRSNNKTSTFYTENRALIKFSLIMGTYLIQWYI
jgi:hypothetical protein